MITSDGFINFAEFELISLNPDGKFYAKLDRKSPRVVEVSQDIFKMILIDNAKEYENAKNNCSVEFDRVLNKRKLTYMYYENQIDLKNEDMFSALLYGPNLWIYMK